MKGLLKGDSWVALVEIVSVFSLIHYNQIQDSFNISKC